MLRTLFWLLFVIVVGALPARVAYAGCNDFPNVAPGLSPPYSPQLLTATHACVLDAYKPGRATDFMLAQPLERAGVDTLLGGPGGLSTRERAAILNDYGFLLSQDPTRLAEAIFVLHAVTRIDPSRAIAWLNLGDAYRAGLTGSSSFKQIDLPSENATWSGRITLTRSALDAYRHYQALGKTLPAADADFMAHNMTNEPTGNVCAFVADYANRGQEAELYIGAPTDNPPVPIDLLGDGRKFYVNIFDEGTADISIITASLSPTKTGSFHSDVNFDPLDGITWNNTGDINPGDELHLFLFRDKYYVLHDAFTPANAASLNYDRFPIEVVQPNKGVVCGVAHRITPRLAVGAGLPICETFLHGLLRHASIPPSGNEASTDHRGDPALPWESGVGPLTTVDLENDGHQIVLASYEQASSAGAGCDTSGVVQYDPTGDEIPQSALNKELINLPNDCRGSSAYPISFFGKTYIEVDHGGEGALLQGEAWGMGIYEVKADHVLPVCVIHNDMKFSAD